MKLVECPAKRTKKYPTTRIASEIAILSGMLVNQLFNLVPPENPWQSFRGTTIAITAIAARIVALNSKIAFKIILGWTKKSLAKRRRAREFKQTSSLLKRAIEDPHYSVQEHEDFRRKYVHLMRTEIDTRIIRLLE